MGDLDSLGCVDCGQIVPKYLKGGEQMETEKVTHEETETTETVVEQEPHQPEQEQDEQGGEQQDEA